MGSGSCTVSIFSCPASATLAGQATYFLIFIPANPNLNAHLYYLKPIFFFRCRSIWVWLWCGIKFVTTSRPLNCEHLRTCLALSGHRSTRRLYSAIRQILSSNFRVPDIGSMKATLKITVHSLIRWRVKMPKNGNDFQILIPATSE